MKASGATVRAEDRQSGSAGDSAPGALFVMLIEDVCLSWRSAQRDATCL